MYLSQLLVNMGRGPDQPCPGKEWIKQTYRVHQRLWMAFPDAVQKDKDPFFLGTWSAGETSKPKRSEAGFLFRIEPDRPTRILVQSLLKPDWNYAFQNAPYLLEGPPQMREFEPAFAEGQCYRFRLVMLMVKRATRRDGSGKRQSGTGARAERPIFCVLPDDGSGIPKPDPQHTLWRDRLAEVGLRHGFTVAANSKQLQVVPDRSLRMKPAGRGQAEPFNAALFEGLLTCTNATLLRDAVVNGIGRGKAFGMGLLSLAVVN